MGEQFPFEYAPGATPLDPNETKGLIATYISTQGELNLLEQKNILEAKTWLANKKQTDILTDTFLKNLHQRMFKTVWKWAGNYRTTDKSIGVPWQHVSVEISKLLQNTKHWIENETYDWDEIGVRFHHKLVFVHAFANGNGRHARLMADVLMRAYNQNEFSWGAKTLKGHLEAASDMRDEYISALREADNRNYNRLINFAKS